VQLLDDAPPCSPRLVSAAGGGVIATSAVLNKLVFDQNPSFHVLI
jgi:hypothetical protein